MSIYLGQHLLTGDGGGLSISHVTQAEYDALATKDANTIYVVDMGAKIYLGSHELALAPRIITLPAGGAYVDTGFDTDTSTIFGWRLTVRASTEDESQSNDIFFARTSDLSNPGASQTVPAIGDIASNQNSLTSFAIASSGSYPRALVGVDSSGNVLFGLRPSNAQNALELIVSSDLTGYLKTDVTNRPDLSIPDSTFAAYGLTLPSDVYSLSVWYRVGTTALANFGIFPDTFREILALPASSVGDTASATNAIVSPNQWSTPTGLGRPAFGITSTNELLIASAPPAMVADSSYVQRPLFLGSDSSGINPPLPLWMSRVWRPA